MFHISSFCLVVSHCEHLCTSVFPSLQESLYPHPQIHHDISYPWRNLQCYGEILVLVVVRLQSERMFRDYSFVQFRECLPHNLELPCAESTVNAKYLTVIGKRFHCFGSTFSISSATAITDLTVFSLRDNINIVVKY